MRSAIAARNRITDGMTREELDELDKDSFGDYGGRDGRPDYFPASIIQKSDGEGNTINDLRIFDESLANPDIAVPDGALIRTIKGMGRRPK